MKNAENLRRIIAANNNGKKVPALALVNSDPTTAAVISKLVRSRDPRKVDPLNEKSFYDIDSGRLSQISDSIKERISDADNMMQLFPDLELAAQILVSSILSPKDMVSVDLIYKTSEPVFSVDLTMKLMDIIERECETHYKLRQKLPDILREVLFNSGAYIRAVIPESSVDDLINGGGQISVEQLKEIATPAGVTSLGILGPRVNKVEGAPVRIGLESFKVQRVPIQHFEIEQEKRSVSKEVKSSDFYDISDNYKLLKLPKLIDANNRNKVRSIIKSQSVGLESKPLSEKEIETILYKGTQGRARPFVSIKTQRATQRQSVGRPLCLRLPAEAVIPVHVPGDETTHIGYFVLIDEEGNPVTLNNSRQQTADLQSRLQETSHSMTSMLLARARRNIQGQDNRNLSLDQAAKIYSSIIENDLIAQFRTSIYGSKVEIGRNEEVYRIMLARSYANQFTRLVYVPAEIVSYYAYKYHDNGVGKSLLDDLKTLISLRGILLFSKVMALTKNSIALTHVNMTLDPNDPDPQKTIEMSIHEIIKMRQQYFPLGINSPVDLVDWIQRAGFEFTFEGHPGIPQTRFDFDTKQMQHTVPDSDLDEMLRKQTFMAMGLSPETVDNGFSAEFATTVVANNILLSKRVLQIQEKFTPTLSEDVRKIVLNDYTIRDQLMEILRENKASVENFIPDELKEDFKNDTDGFLGDMLEQFINVIEIDLPKPDITSMENQSQAYDHYSETLDKCIDSWVSSEFITQDISGDVSSNVDTIKAILKAYYLRRWMAENGFMTELKDIVAKDENGDPIIDIFGVMEEHMEGVMRSAVKFIDSMKEMRAAANKDLENLGTPEGSSDYSSSDTAPSSSDTGSDEAAGGTGGGDLGGDLSDLGF